MNPPRVPADLTPAIAHGGTFVRPGAFAWGRPGSPDRDAGGAASGGPGGGGPGGGAGGGGADSAAAGTAIIEDALAVAIKDPDRLTDLLDELRRGRVWVPLPEQGGPVTDGSAVHLPTVTYLGEEFVPVFTSAERLGAWPFGGSGGSSGSSEAAGTLVPHIVVPAAELARRLPRDLGIALNPGAGVSVPIYPDGVGHLAATDDDEVSVGHPPTEPVALLGEVRATLGTVPAVRQASRAWLRVPGQGEGLVISVALHDPACPQAHRAVIEAVERAASAVPHQFPIDVTFPGEDVPDQVDEWISVHAEPFYVRP
jgi:hypothetical protein